MKLHGLYEQYSFDSKYTFIETFNGSTTLQLDFHLPFQPMKNTTFHTFMEWSSFCCNPSHIQLIWDKYIYLKRVLQCFSCFQNELSTELKVYVAFQSFVCNEFDQKYEKKKQKRRNWPE